MKASPEIPDGDVDAANKIAVYGQWQWLAALGAGLGTGLVAS